MNVLVLNAGSTSLRYHVYDMDLERALVSGRVERIGDGARHVRGDGKMRTEVAIEAADHAAAFRAVLDVLGSSESGIELASIGAIGHRVVHGGEKLTMPVRIDASVKARIAECARFAPLHNPSNLAGIEAAEEALPGVPHVAVFDTAFHADLPPEAFLYGVPYELYLEKSIRRYGFHGPSHQFMAQSASEFLRTDLSRLRLVTCHLGGGASVCAIDRGRSVDVSMGMTPLEGLVMATRSGDVDPALAQLLVEEGMSPSEVTETLNRRSGLLGLSGVSSDFRDIEAAADAGNDRARLAIEVFVHRVRKYIGSYAALLGGIDALVFTGGIGANSARVRRAIADRLLYMGISVDTAANESASPKGALAVADVASQHAPTRVLVVATDEERMIAREVVRTLVGPTAARTRVGGSAIPVGVSVRHVHLSRRDCDVLFGEGYELTMRRPVTQPGQYVCRETIDLVGPKGELQRVAIINPLRAETQVELARSDAFALGVNPPLRESGKLEGSAGIRLRGPRGELDIERGVILAHRHVHMSPDDAERLGVRDGANISVRVDGQREATLGDVIVRVREDFALDLHVDTDEANATGLTSDSVVSFERIEDSH